jgi:hypothetical protein
MLSSTFEKYILPAILHKFQGQKLLHTPNTKDLPVYWKSLQNDTGESIYLADNLPQLVSKDSFFILSCNADGMPIEPLEINYRERSDIQEYL